MARVGISGWTYPPWRGVFYPKGLPQRSELGYAAGRLATIEINGSFYSLQHPSSYRSWHDQTPDDFVFAVKGGRFITHMKKLRGAETALANFVASGVLALRGKLGPLLWQLPPTLGFDAERLADFFARLPRSTAEAAWLARHHDARVDGRALTDTVEDRPLRHALEVRHASFVTPEFPALLREHHIGLVVADTAGRWPFLLDVTADFVYVRLHGDVELYASGYSEAALDVWAGRVRAWTDAGRDVYVYFDNDMKVRAPFDAMSLAERLTR
ncbi:MAG TPA: DUF72 domain-containing protein [Jatrophihabitans sp.]|nr:DUF72 domain-containing protein [Jatrophihabitans sp.]